MNEVTTTTTTDLQKITTGLESFENKKTELEALAESVRDLKISGIDDKI